MFRLQDNVPQYYVNNSRDFQLFCRLYDVAFSAAKYAADGVADITDVYNCSENLLPFLATKVGFFDYKDIPLDALRMIISAFPHLIRKKGSLSGIEDCIYLYLRYNHSDNTKFEINFVQDHINITLEKAFSNQYILEAMLKYIIPAGCYVQYDTSNIKSLNTLFVPEESLALFIADNEMNSMIANNRSTVYEHIGLGTIGSAQIYTTEYKEDTKQSFYTSEAVAADVHHQSCTKTTSGDGETYSLNISFDELGYGQVALQDVQLIKMPGNELISYDTSYITNSISYDNLSYGHTYILKLKYYDKAMIEEILQPPAMS